MTVPRLTTPLLGLSAIRNGLIALQAQALAIGELTIARAICAIADDLDRRLGGTREAA
jgi:hypothetical protein